MARPVCMYASRVRCYGLRNRTLRTIESSILTQSHSRPLNKIVKVVLYNLIYKTPNNNLCVLLNSFAAGL